jgi:hypothetical protein
MPDTPSPLQVAPRAAWGTSAPVAWFHEQRTAFLIALAGLLRTGSHRPLSERLRRRETRAELSFPTVVAPMALRCVYTDLDGTLYGRGGSLFRDADGNFSMMQARALEACHRAGVEVVIMSGRRAHRGCRRGRCRRSAGPSGQQR